MRPSDVPKRRWWPDAVVWVVPFVVAAPFLWMIGDVLAGGIGSFQESDSPISTTAFIDFWQRMIEFLTASPRQAGRAGGIGPILVSTGAILAICMATAVPLSIATAMLLAECSPAGHWFGRVVRVSLDVLAGVPSIVFGLFGNALFCRLLDLRFSLIAGGLTLACMVLPLMIRSTEEGFRGVPTAQRQAAASLGFSRWSIIWNITLPQAAPGLLAGLILGIGRALAETAALIFTSGYVDRMPTSLLDSGRALSVHIYDLSMNVPGGNDNAYASALVLIVCLLLINAVAGRLTRSFLQSHLKQV